MKAKEFYNVAIYLRLSRDDEDIDGSKAESNSISSQRDMIRSFIRKQDNMESMIFMLTMAGPVQTLTDRNLSV
mgnify:CR=1 FL=1